MNRKQKMCVIIGAIIALVIIIVAIYKDNMVYEGNGIPYIVENKNVCSLAIINSNGVYEKEIGKIDEIFWLASSVYENETISVDNNNKIYRFTKNEIEIFDDIELNIMAVLKVEANYILIAETKDMVEIEIYSNNLKEKVNSFQVPGAFEYCFVDEADIYYSVSGDEEQFTGVYRYRLTDNINEQIYYNEEMSEEIYPFIYNECVYLAKNVLIQKTSNVNIDELYRLNNGQLEKILDLEDSLKKVLITDKGIYGLLGKNSTFVVELNLTEKSKEVVNKVEDEVALGLYYLENTIYVLTDGGVYTLEGKKMKKQHNMNTLRLVNVFY